MNVRVTIKIVLSVVFCVFVCQTAGAEYYRKTLPLITLSSNEIIKDEFYHQLKGLSDDKDSLLVNNAVTGFGIFDLGWQVGISYIKNVNSWLSIPVFGAGVLALDTTGGFDSGGNYFLGSGLIIKNRFLDLGLTAGYLSGKNTDKNSDFALYPVIKASEFSFLIFLDEISGYFYSNKKASDINIVDLNFLLNIAFKGIGSLTVLELYMHSGQNEFRPELGLQNNRMIVSEWGGITKGGPYYALSKSEGQILNTDVYGIRIGGEHIVVDINYLSISGNFGDAVYNYDNPDEIIDYLEFENYPFNWLKGFPSATLNWFFERWNEGMMGLFTRFNTIYTKGTIGKPYVPDIGFVRYSKDFTVIASWNWPISLSFALTFNFDF